MLDCGHKVPSKEGQRTSFPQIRTSPSRPRWRHCEGLHLETNSPHKDLADQICANNFLYHLSPPFKATLPTKLYNAAITCNVANRRSTAGDPANRNNLYIQSILLINSAHSIPSRIVVVTLNHIGLFALWTFVRPLPPRGGRPLAGDKAGHAEGKESVGGTLDTLRHASTHDGGAYAQTCMNAGRSRKTPDEDYGHVWIEGQDNSGWCRRCRRPRLFSNPRGPSLCF